MTHHIENVTRQDTTLITTRKAVSLTRGSEMPLTHKGITMRSLNNQQSSTYGGFHLLTDKFPSQYRGFVFFTSTPRPQVLCFQTYGGFSLAGRHILHHKTEGFCLFLSQRPSALALLLQMLATHWSSPTARAHTITVTEFLVPRKIGGFCLFFTPTSRPTCLQILVTPRLSPKAQE